MKYVSLQEMMNSLKVKYKGYYDCCYDCKGNFVGVTIKEDEQ